MSSLCLFIRILTYKFKVAYTDIFKMRMGRDVSLRSLAEISLRVLAQIVLGKDWYQRGAFNLQLLLRGLSDALNIYRPVLFCLSSVYAFTLMALLTGLNGAVAPVMVLISRLGRYGVYYACLFVARFVQVVTSTFWLSWLDFGLFGALGMGTPESFAGFVSRSATTILTTAFLTPVAFGCLAVSIFITSRLAMLAWQWRDASTAAAAGAAAGNSQQQGQGEPATAPPAYASARPSPSTPLAAITALFFELITTAPVRAAAAATMGPGAAAGGAGGAAAGPARGIGQMVLNLILLPFLVSDALMAGVFLGLAWAQGLLAGWLLRGWPFGAGLVVRTLFWAWSVSAALFVADEAHRGGTDAAPRSSLPSVLRASLLTRASARIESRAMYFAGFGAPVALPLAFLPFQWGAGVAAVALPWLVIGAILRDAPERQAAAEAAAAAAARRGARTAATPPPLPARAGGKEKGEEGAGLTASERPSESAEPEGAGPKGAGVEALKLEGQGVVPANTQEVQDGGLPEDWGRIPVFFPVRWCLRGFSLLIGGGASA